MIIGYILALSVCFTDSHDVYRCSYYIPPEYKYPLTLEECLQIRDMSDETAKCQAAYKREDNE